MSQKEVSKMNYEFVQNWREVLRRAFVTRVFELLHRKDLKLFVRTNDLISIAPILYGDYEPHVLAFFNWASEAKYCDFFIDIGGNIGLSCCPVMDRFARFFVFEPNPLAFKILEVNVASTNDESKYTLFNFGIGPNDERLDLMIPKHNWGGAYIVSGDNSYSEEVLSKKDGFNSTSPDNCIRTEVEMRSGSAVFGSIFGQMLNLNSAPKGVIKIDVEGFELSVIEELGKSLPKNVSAILIFENWDNNFDLDRALTAFRGRASAYRIKRKSPFSNRVPLILKMALFPIAAMFGRGSNSYSLEDIGTWSKGDDIVGDLVLKVIS